MKCNCDIHEQDFNWILATIKKSKFKYKAQFFMYNLITQNMSWFT